MTDSLVLTSAEVFALCGLTESSRANQALDLLKVAGDARTDPVRQAGLASLLARDLARVDADSILLASGPERVVTSLTGFRTGLQVGLITGEHGDGFLIFDAPGARVLIAPRAFASFAILGLDPADDFATQLGEIIKASLPEDAEAVVAVVAADPEPDLLRSVVAGVSHGRWTLVATGSDGPKQYNNRDEAMGWVIDRLRMLVGQYRPPPA